MSNNKTLYIVHCIDTEGPLEETISSTFERLKSIFDIEMEPSHENLKKIQNMEFNFDGNEVAIARCFSEKLLNYNSSWNEINYMLDRILSPKFRNKIKDDFGNGWVYSWHCLDHEGFIDNPRNKDIGYGKVFNYYKQKIFK